MDKKYRVVKPIPLFNGSTIPVNSAIYEIHGNYYMDGGLLPESYQEDFHNLIKHESQNGWKYLRPDNPVVGKPIINK